MSIKQELAANIKAHRLKSGLSQDKLASKADISTRYYQDIESAEKQPSIDTLFKLSVALEVDFIALLGPVWKTWLKNSREAS